LRYLGNFKYKPTNIKYMSHPVDSPQILSFFAFFLIALMVPYTACGLSTEPTVIVTGYTITPDVLLPHDIGIVEVTIANTAQQASKTATENGGRDDAISQSITVPVNAFVESAILKTKDFTILSGWYQDIGEIGPGQSTTLTFMLQAPEKEGLYFPEVWIRVRGAESVKYPIPINVNTRHTLIKQPSIRLLRTLPANITPGSLFDLPVALHNDGLAPAHDIILEISTPNRSLSSLTPERLFFSELKPGETVPINLSFQSDDDIPVGIRQIPIRITYLTADGTRLMQNEQIGIMIQGTAELGISKQILDPERVFLGDMFSLVYRIENTGTAKAKSVQTTLDIPFEGTKDAFVGTIGPDNDAPAVFTLKATKSGDVSFNLSIKFKDDYGIHEEVIPLHLYVSEQNGSTLGIILGTIILVGAGLLYWRRKQSRI
jgi:hypothetical protein